jgi:alkanesulfonate monooxygenase SsuD/methylene tetrahydromethanopterin reductase-like flavin-dependent oxidoreductase (luciferase family)
MGQLLRGKLGRFGIWHGARQTTPELAASIEQLGYGALWLGGSPDGDLAIAAGLLDATSTLMVGTSIVNIWKDDADTVARSFARLTGRHPGRFVLLTDADSDPLPGYANLARALGLSRRTH